MKIKRSHTFIHRRSFYIFGYAICLMAWSNNLYGDDQTHVETWKITDGSLILHTQIDALQEHGLQFTTPLLVSQDGEIPSSITLTVSASSTIDVEVLGNSYRLVGGDIQFDQPLQLSTQWLERDLQRLSLKMTTRDHTIEFVLTGSTSGKDEGVEFQTANLRFDPAGRSLVIDSETMGLTQRLANKINRQSLAQPSLASAVFRASLERYMDGELIAAPDIPVSQTQSMEASVASGIGPDVIVATLPQIKRYGSNYSSICGKCLEFPHPGNVSECDAATPAPCMSAYVIGTTSCNIGDQRAKWVSSTNEHPVIAQNMYRLRSNRFEQIGMSWVKHGFFALSGDYCGDCFDAPGLECTDTRATCTSDSDCTPGIDCFDYTGKELGVGCSDPYTVSLNSLQDYLGPRSDINPFTGAFAYNIPHGWPPYSLSDKLARRIRVQNSDLDPNLNAGAQYFMEGHYVTADDALADNGTNNTSFRPVLIINTGVEAYEASASGTTRTERAAIQAWRENDSSVVESVVQVPNEGKFILAAKAWELNNGLWRYEYALQNINSDRAAGSFSVALPVGNVITNIGFHDVDSHSGEFFDSTDWFPTELTESIVWATTPYALYENANALRWGTLYNFRFDANVAPQPASVTVGLFKPGSPNEIEVASIGPAIGLIDCNNNGTADICDLNCDVPGCVEPCGTAIDCNFNSIPDDCEADCNGNTIADSCDISNETSTDCNINLIPDDCDIASEESEDCNLNNLPDECEILPDTDLDGVKDCYDACPTDAGPPNACLCPEYDRCCISPDLCIQEYPRSECLASGWTPDCQFTPCKNGCKPGDFDGDGDVDLRDSRSFMFECFSGSIGLPEYVEPSADCLLRFDYNLDLDVDYSDLLEYTHDLSGPSSP